MGPGLFTGAMTLGILIQTSSAFREVQGSFSLFMQNWTRITELRSIFKRLNEFEKAISKKTLLVSFMHINNEVGSINDIKSIGKICRKSNIFFHVDAAQGIGKLSVDVKDCNIDLMSLSAHKIYGPKGIGALFINKE